jgi:hypothetical protein
MAMADWQPIYADAHDRLEMLPVPGGFLYRNWVRASSDAAVPQVSLVFVPEIAPVAPPARRAA